MGIALPDFTPQFRHLATGAKYQILCKARPLNAHRMAENQNVCLWLAHDIPGLFLAGAGVDLRSATCISQKVQVCFERPFDDPGLLYVYFDRTRALFARRPSEVNDKALFHILSQEEIDAWPTEHRPNQPGLFAAPVGEKGKLY